MTQLDSVESAGGRLGAVLSAPRSGVVALGRHGPWLTTSLDQARQVLTDVSDFDFPGDVTRSGDLSASRGETRSGHVVFPPVTPDRVARGLAVFAAEWDAALAEHDRSTPDEPYDAMALLRRPVARCTTTAVLPSLDVTRRDLVADLVLDWIDALAPVIAARRPPRRWSRARRREGEARSALHAALAVAPGLDGPPQLAATMLAAGIQVPIAAGAWLVAWLAAHPSKGPRQVDASHVVWETLRLTPPTWITARITTREVDLDGHRVPSGAVVLVSPLLLGRLPELVPGEPSGLTGFAPDRWRDETQRPGAWLPFGAGPHACPGRHLGMAILTHLSEWGLARRLALSQPVVVDQSRGIAPLPCRFVVATREAGAGA
ncbi:cytochrome P450 [Nocardioides sp. zg-1228]|uniref:cytochrome P450 n=1 Tax=Nocardioides sp. zg-1228 TaxID=2763008 RepID=UPI001642F5C0|nr:cytochrome P450 [Nocardioides sp. zg-1228]MBC2931692.1 cytochrome P450 [Nocardioides sp. zg-1228]QSF57281.1 cytochrome P450 [Nocardioides sp. zg-1228]